MDRVLIVARMDGSDVDTVTKIWTESDATELPHLIGVKRRSLFSFHGLYFHLIESDDAVRPQIRNAREHPLFRAVNDALEPYVTAYDPRTWRGPEDAMAQRFYSWSAS